MSAYAPYGYKRVHVQDGPKKRPRLELDPPADAMVRRIFDMALHGKSILNITKTLNAEGIPTVNGKKWLKTTVHTMLNNEAYTGAVVWGTTAKDGQPPVRVENAHPAIISKGEYRRVKKLLGSRAPKQASSLRAWDSSARGRVELQSRDVLRPATSNTEITRMGSMPLGICRPAEPEEGAQVHPACVGAGSFCRSSGTYLELLCAQAPYRSGLWRLSAPAFTTVLAALVMLATVACGLFANGPEPSATAPTSETSSAASGSPGRAEPGTGIEVKPGATPQPTVTPLPTATPYPTATPFPTAAPVAGAVATQPPTTGVATPVSSPAVMPTAAATVGSPGASTGSAQFSFSRKPELTHPKVGTALNQLIARVAAGEISAEEAAREAPIHRGDSVGVAIHLSENVDGVVRFLEANGASNISARGDYIEAYVPVLLLAETSEQPGVIRVRPIQPPEDPQSGSGISGNGPGVHGSAAWNQAGFTGEGIKVGVIDGGFGGFAELMGTEVPADVRARCYRGLGEHSEDLEHCGGSTHGTVVAESVMDIAPEVSLYIADPQSPGELSDTVDWMISQGVSVINHSMTWLFDGPGDGTSPSFISPLNTVDRAVEAGMVWVNAAGNSAQRTWFKRGPFSYSTITVDGEDFRVLNFDASNFTNRFHVWGSLQLRWDDTWSGATRDLNLFLASPDGDEITLVSKDTQSGEDGHTPYERVVAFASYDVMIAHHSGSEPGWIQLLAFRGEGPTYSTPDAGSTINPAESASSGMLAVGAAHWNNVNSIESYSSRGPTPDGRIKPDVVAAACGETAARSLPFCGTSQAAPHVAGLAALVRQRFPEYTPTEVVSYLKENGEQRVSSPDPNNTWGHGFIVLPPIAQRLLGSPTVTSVTAGASSLTVAWRAPSDDGGSAVTAYDLRHIRSGASSKADPNWTVVQDAWTGSGSLSYVVTGLDVGARYDVQVRAVTTAGDGPWSATMTGATASTSPGAPTGLAATASGQTQIDLSWSAPSNTGGSPITGYRIEVSDDGSNWSGLVSNTGSAATRYAHTGLTGGSTRHYRVSAINSAGTGPVSNVSFATTAAALAPDLSVDTPTVSGSAPVAGGRFTLNATVRNRGSGRSGSTTLRYYRSTDATITTGDTAVGTDSVSGLAASGSGAESISLTAPSTPGTYHYGACVDAVSEESDTTNNCSTAVTVNVGVAPAPDLEVDTPTVDTSAPAAGTTFALSATVRNQGNGSSNSTTLRYYRSTDSTITSGDTLLGTDPVARLDASGSGGEWISLTAPSTPGTYYYGACVDAVSGESDTTNNCSTAVTVNVGAAPAPDLVVDAPTVDTSAPAAGTTFALSATVRNQGNGSSDSATLRYYRSTDSTITRGDTAVGTDSVSSLDAAESGGESISLTAPSTAGTYYYGACVDAVSDETDTTNNCSSSVAVTVGAAPAPDIVVDTPTVDTSAPAAGARFTLNATVRNQGNGSSAFATLRYYRSNDSTITTGDTEVGTDSVSSLDAAESGDESISLTAPSTSGTYYYGACVDAVSDETDTTNNCSTGVTVTVGTTPVNPPNQRYTWQGSTIVVSWDSVPDADYYNIYYDDFFDSNCQLSFGNPFLCEELASNITSASYTHMSPDETTNYYWITACNDAGCSAIDSANPARREGAVPAPDLVVDTPTVDTSAPVAGARFMLSATVRNQGSARSGSTTLRYYQSTDSTITAGDTEVGTDLVSRLDASGSGAESISLTAPSTPGTYYYGACVDAVSDETDTTNNCSAAVTVTVGAAPAPDLVADTPTVSESAPSAGASFTLNATVRNQGSARSGLTTLRYYQSTDATITTGDTAVGTDLVSGLAASGSGAESISLTAPSTSGTYYYGACVDAVSDETDTTNNCSAAVTVTVGAAPAPDLVWDRPTVNNSNPDAGASFTLVFTVRNQGNGSSALLTLRYYQSNDPTITTGDTEVATDRATGLDPGGTTTRSVSPGSVSTPGTYYYGACVDAVSDETDTTNNCSSAVTVTVGAAPAPDLVVDTPTVSESAPSAGASFTLNATVRNQGSGASGSTTLRYYRSTDATITTGDTAVGTDSVSRIAASGSGAESINLTAPSTSGTYYYGACVDALSDESDTTNNCSSAVTVTVGAAPAPDLVVDTPTVSESAPTAGASFALNATVRNQGSGASGSTTLRYYRSTDSTITTGDTAVGTDSVGGLSASGSSAESISLTAPSTPGTYYYGACVDSVSDESDTTNNCSSAVTVAVGAAPVTSINYDSNSNGLIEIANLEQLNAIRWDLNGDGAADESASITEYAAAFPNAAENMGCVPSGCTGYELARDLDFNSAASYASGMVNENWRTGTGWDPIGGLRALNSGSQTSFNTEFDGNGRTISNLYIDYSGQSDNNNLGLFGRTRSESFIHDIGLVAVDVSGGRSIGGLVGYNDGAISDSYATGEVSGNHNVGGLVGNNWNGAIATSHAAVKVSGGSVIGGLVGLNSGILSSSNATGEVSGPYGYAGGLVGNNWNGAIATSYASGNVSGIQWIGGLVGQNLGNAGPGSSAIISASYATGNVSASRGYAGGLVGQNLKDIASTGTGSSAIISASYATGNVSASGRYAGGLIGNNGGTIYTSYWDTSTSGRAVGVGTDDVDNDNVLDADETATPGAIGKTTAELRTPRGYTGIYASWNIDLDGDGSSDNPWVFGTSSQYPTLNTVAVDKVVPPSPTVTAPGAPTGLTATANGQTQIDLSWNAPSSDGGADITGYRIEVSTNGSSWSDLVANTVSTATSYSHTGLTAGTTRHYRVSAINSAGTGQASSSDSATTEAAPATTPSAPTGLAATADGQTEIDLSWSAPSDDGGAAITGYRIEVSTNGSSWSDLVADTGSTTTTYSHTGLSAGSMRHYRVSAINSAGTGSASNSDSATTAEESVPDGTCTVDLIVEPGESCTYPGTSTEFSVDADGTGVFLFTSSGSSITLRNTTINGVTYTFVASKRSDGSWRVEEVG